MDSCFVIDTPKNSIGILALTPAQLARWRLQQSEQVTQWLAMTQFTAKEGSFCLLPSEQGRLSLVLLGLGGHTSYWAFGSLARGLPDGVYHIEPTEASVDQLTHGCLAWGLGAYRYSRYKTPVNSLAVPRLVIPNACDLAQIEAISAAVYLVRDLVNTPTEDMGPAELTSVASELVNRHKGQLQVVLGEELLTHNYPAIYSVGKASIHPPRLLDLRFGDEKLPKVTLVGKGVCFDSGGLDLKSSSGMRHMKKDMAGAAHALGLAQLMLQQEIPVNLRVLIPAVENAVSGNSYHPGDIITMRTGKTVEVTNTDAEGRLVLADALAEASSEDPDLLIDFATLTGAARVALGPDVSALMTPSDELAAGLAEAAQRVADPVWRMPLHAEYREFLESSLADMVNAVLGDQGGGAITAGLFLESFVADPSHWLHLDIMAWNNNDRPGRPSGAEAHGLRAVFEYIRTRYRN